MIDMNKKKTTEKRKNSRLGVEGYEGAKGKKCETRGRPFVTKSFRFCSSLHRTGVSLSLWSNTVSLLGFLEVTLKPFSPCSPVPHAKTCPLSVRKSVCAMPAHVCTTVLPSSDSIRRGDPMASRPPLPSCPQSLSPHEKTFKQETQHSAAWRWDLALKNARLGGKNKVWW